jgi:subtilisin family serine protease
VGKRTPFSSIGPTMTGLLKPDVMAPGENVVSSYSSFYLGYNPTANDLNSDVARFVHEGRVYSWNSNSGTSMSCPVAAGVIALWLQANPKLTHHDVRDIFSRTCAHPDAALDYPNNEYGYGEINAYLGLLDILGISKVEAVSLHQPRQALVRVGNGALQLQFASVPKQTVTVSIYSVAGARLLQTKLKPSGTEATIDLPRLPAGVYAVQLNCADSSFAGSQLIRL